MELDLIELNRCRDAESVAETTGPLDSANIAYKVGSTAVNFDISKIGTGDDPEVIISVRKEDYAAARAVLEEEYSKYDLPDDHYLLNSSDEELADILAKPSEWNAYDVVHARRISKERGLDPALIEKKKAERIRKLKEGKPASKKLQAGGWAASILGCMIILGGLAGVGIGLSLCLMKEKTPDGDFHTYDAKTRKIGGFIMVFAIVMTLLGIFLRVAKVL
mgnify:FL=1